MYYKYFDEQTTGKKVKQILIDIIKSVIYAFILTFILSFAIGFRPIYIIGDSMTPEIMKHDIILIKKVAENDIKPGDVITFDKDGSNVTHRLVGIENGLFYTKDELSVLEWQAEGKTFEEVKSHCDTPFTYDKVKGRYVHRFVVMGDIVEFLTTDNGRKLNIASIIDVLLTIVACSFIIKIFKNADDKYNARG